MALFDLGAVPVEAGEHDGPVDAVAVLGVGSAQHQAHADDD